MTKNHTLIHPVSREFVQIKCGFSWPACLFNPMWAVLKQLWWHALVLFSISLLIIRLTIALRLLDSFFGALVYFSTLTIYMIICGVKGNTWWRESLLKRGFRYYEHPNQQFQQQPGHHPRAVIPENRQDQSTF